MSDDNQVRGNRHMPPIGSPFAQPAADTMREFAEDAARMAYEARIAEREALLRAAVHENGDRRLSHDQHARAVGATQCWPVHTTAVGSCGNCGYWPPGPIEGGAWGVAWNFVREHPIVTFCIVLALLAAFAGSGGSESGMAWFGD